MGLGIAQEGMMGKMTRVEKYLPLYEFFCRSPNLNPRPFALSEIKKEIEKETCSCHLMP